MRELLLDGASLIVDEHHAVDDVVALLRDLDYDLSSIKRRETTDVDLDGDLRTIYDAITEDCTVDDIAANAGLPSARVAPGLAELELDGLVSASNGRWRRT